MCGRKLPVVDATGFGAIGAEATRLLPAVGGSVGVGAVRFVADGGVLEEFASLIDARWPIPAVAGRIPTASTAG